MRGYELCLIFHPETSESDIDNIINSLSELITSHKGSVLKTEKWEKKNFQYQIKKQSKGYYCFLYYMGNNEILNEIERIVKFNESVLRYNNYSLQKNFAFKETARTLENKETEQSASDKPEKTIESTPVEKSTDTAATNE